LFSVSANNLDIVATKAYHQNPALFFLAKFSKLDKRNFKWLKMCFFGSGQHISLVLKKNLKISLLGSAYSLKGQGIFRLFYFHILFMAKFG
jgi:hypothetical protein